MKNEQITVPMTKIEVTADDIINGIPFSPCRCPIALALERITGKKWWVRNTIANERCGSLMLGLPKIAIQWRADFDLGNPVEPFTFELAI